MNNCTLPTFPKDDKCSGDFKTIQWTIVNDKIYEDGVYFGIVLKNEDNILTVQCDNGNKYMQGSVRKFQIIKQ